MPHSIDAGLLEGLPWEGKSAKRQMSLPGSHTVHVGSSLAEVGSHRFHYCSALRAKGKKIQFTAASVTLYFNQMDTKESLADAQTD